MLHTKTSHFTSKARTALKTLFLAATRERETRQKTTMDVVAQVATGPQIPEYQEDYSEYHASETTAQDPNLELALVATYF
jgi:hypothetical protein